ncbi:MAG: ferritin family protein [Elusimicrobiales bacterium]|nr:ferritin family protein [Elusimicrobiales bacterium]
MDPKQLIQQLVNEETGDISLYAREAELFSRKIVDGRRIAETFSRFSAEEASHLRVLAAIAGGEVRAGRREIGVGSSLTLALKVHEEREAESLRLYNDLAASLEDPAHKIMLKGVIDQEKSHLETIRKYLKALRASKREE